MGQAAIVELSDGSTRSSKNRYSLVRSQCTHEASSSAYRSTYTKLGLGLKIGEMRLRSILKPFERHTIPFSSSLSLEVGTAKFTPQSCPSRWGKSNLFVVQADLLMEV